MTRIWERYAGAWLATALLHPATNAGKATFTVGETTIESIAIDISA